MALIHSCVFVGAVLLLARQYRLCPADSPLTEACFQLTPLDFVGNSSLRWGYVASNARAAIQIRSTLSLTFFFCSFAEPTHPTQPQRRRRGADFLQHYRARVGRHG